MLHTYPTTSWRLHSPLIGALITGIRRERLARLRSRRFSRLFAAPEQEAQ